MFEHSLILVNIEILSIFENNRLLLDIKMFVNINKFDHSLGVFNIWTLINIRRSSNVG